MGIIEKLVYMSMDIAGVANIWKVNGWIGIA
jgi:hypothetical protein